MPFKSDAQRRYFHWAESRGKLPKGTSAKWQAHTSDKDLPERVNKEADMIKRSEQESYYKLASMLPQQNTTGVSRVLNLEYLRKLAGDVYEWDKWKDKAQAGHRKKHPLGGGQVYKFPEKGKRVRHRIQKDVKTQVGKLTRHRSKIMGGVALLAALGLTMKEIRDYKKIQGKE